MEIISTGRKRAVRCDRLLQITLEPLTDRPECYVPCIQRSVRRKGRVVDRDPAGLACRRGVQRERTALRRTQRRFPVLPLLLVKLEAKSLRQLLSQQRPELLDHTRILGRACPQPKS